MPSYADKAPYGWFIGTYQLRFVVVTKRREDKPTQRFRVWENTVIVRAKSLTEARRKVTKIGQLEARPYQGGEQGVDVQWRYEGIIELLPIYEQLEDGAEILWAERTMSLGKMRSRVLPTRK